MTIRKVAPPLLELKTKRSQLHNSRFGLVIWKHDLVVITKQPSNAVGSTLVKWVRSPPAHAENSPHPSSMAIRYAHLEVAGKILEHRMMSHGMGLV